MSKSQYCIDNIDVCLLGVSDIAKNITRENTNVSQNPQGNPIAFSFLVVS